MMNNEIYNIKWKPKVKMVVGKGLTVNKFPGSRSKMEMGKGSNYRIVLVSKKDAGNLLICHGM